MPRLSVRAVPVLVLVLAAAACSGSAVSSSPPPAPSTVLPRATPSAVAPSSASSSPSGEASPTSAARPLVGRVVLLDPGHNGGNASHPAEINRLVDVVTQRKACDTTGTATNAGYPEYAFTLDVARRAARLLRADGATVVLTRGDSSGVGPCITERAAIGNRAHADAAISIHADGGPPGGYGFHVIEPADVGPNAAIVAPSRRLGRDVRDAFRDGTGEPYSTYAGSAALVTRSDLGGLNLSTVPKVFVECANMRNAVDARRLTDPAFRERAAASIARGITAFLGDM